MMFGLALGNQNLVLLGKSEIIELHNAMDNFEALFGR